MPEPRERSLSLTWTYILVALCDGPRHGYAIQQEVTDRTEGAVNLWPATLYGAIRRLQRDGLVSESEERPDDGDDARRRYYEITEAGREAVAAELHRLDDLVRLGRDRHVFRGS